MTKRKKTRNLETDIEKIPSEEIRQQVNKLKEKLAKEGYKDLRFLARGKRGILLYGKKKDKEICIKHKNPLASVDTIKNEYEILNMIKDARIAPKSLELRKDYLIMEYIPGILIGDFINKEEREEVILVIWQLIDYMFLLDLLRLNKQEMNHPHKHILVKQIIKGNTSKYKPYLVDFERARISNNPKNLSQFCSFITGSYFTKDIKSKDIAIKKDKIRRLIKEYKRLIIQLPKLSSNKKNKRIREIIQDLTKESTRKHIWRILNEMKRSLFLKPKTLKDKVLIEAGKIPFGKTCSYKYLANNAYSKAYQAIGSIMANNRFSPVIPCHRVIKSNRELGSYNHRPNNPIKRKMLEEEGVSLYKKGKKYYVDERDFLG